LTIGIAWLPKQTIAISRPGRNQSEHIASDFAPVPPGVAVLCAATEICVD
jgi:hypothetical protein